MKQTLSLLVAFIFLSLNISIAEETDVNLVKKFNLYSTNRIVIEVSLGNSKGKVVEINDSQIIKSIIKELGSTKTIPVQDTWVQYKIKFYDERTILNELGYNDELNFLRYKHGVDFEYVPSEIFRNIILTYVNRVG